MVNSFPETFAPRNDSSKELLLPGTFVLWNFRSHNLQIWYRYGFELRTWLGSQLWSALGFDLCLELETASVVK